MVSAEHGWRTSGSSNSGRRLRGSIRQHVELLRLRTDRSRRRALAFADHLHKLDATQNDPRTTKVLAAL
jgi:hypothetical protein